ncbi:hypothetical protein [Actinoplanes solisilvae]|uniref:hypothetical protein n=1 Tax=Actinoplanes solisilvae TaxID=2486853 RepID=UPI0013E3521F|nr:hypothetical protein [Actinoplanes solisilvae]
MSTWDGDIGGFGLGGRNGRFLFGGRNPTEPRPGLNGHAPGEVNGRSSGPDLSAVSGGAAHGEDADHAEAQDENGRDDMNGRAGIPGVPTSGAGPAAPVSGPGGGPEEGLGRRAAPDDAGRRPADAGRRAAADDDTGRRGTPDETPRRATPDGPGRAFPETPGSRTTPEPTGSRAVPDPLASRTVPDPHTSRTVPDPLTGRAVPEPLAGRAVPEPLAGRAVPEPLAGRAVPESPAERATPDEPARRATDETGRRAADETGRRPATDDAGHRATATADETSRRATDDIGRSTADDAGDARRAAAGWASVPTSTHPIVSPTSAPPVSGAPVAASPVSGGPVFGASFGQPPSYTPALPDPASGPVSGVPAPRAAASIAVPVAKPQPPADEKAQLGITFGGPVDEGPRRSASLEDAEPVRRGRRAAPDEFDDEQGHDDAPLRPGDVAAGNIAFWDEDATRHFRAAWHEVKAEFVDDPVTALTRAHDLLTDAVNELTEALLAERDELDPLRGTGTPDTESMRMAMRGYREFLDRILSL